MNFAQKLIRNYEIIKDQDIDKKINLLSNKITDKIKKNKIFMAGNGGSAAQAQHFSTELIVRYNKKYKNRSYPCISLCADNVLLTACANDYGYDQIFAKQLEGLSKSGDILILFSTSGNSENLLKAAEYANKNNIEVFSILGSNGGGLKNISQENIIINSDDTAIIQEIHLSIIHSIVESIDEKLNV